MNKIIGFFKVASLRLATIRLAKLAALAHFDKNGVLLDLCGGNIELAYDALVYMHEPEQLEVAS